MRLFREAAALTTSDLATRLRELHLKELVEDAQRVLSGEWSQDLCLDPHWLLALGGSDVRVHERRRHRLRSYNLLQPPTFWRRRRDQLQAQRVSLT